MIVNSQQFNEAFKKLPYVLRQYIAEDDLSVLSESIGKKYNLHVDTTGALYRETTNMLLGLINPTQFVGELKSVGIPEASIGAIVDELNVKVFMPLREKMKNPPIESETVDVDPADTPEQNHSVVPPPQYVPPVAARPISAPVTQTRVQHVAHIAQPDPQVIPPAPAYTMPVAAVRPSVSEFSVPPAAIPSAAATTFSMSPASFSSSIPQPVTPPENIVAPHARTMQEDMRMAQEHPGQTAPTQPSQAQQQYQPQPFSAPQPTNPPLVTPTRPPAYAQAPVRHLTPQAPSAFASPASPSLSTQNFSMPAVPPAAQPAPAPRNENRDALHAVLKGYGVDPYREPAD